MRKAGARMIDVSNEVESVLHQVNALASELPKPRASRLAILANAFALTVKDTGTDEAEAIELIECTLDGYVRVDLSCMIGRN